MRILAAFAAAAAALAALITPAHADGPLGAKGDTLSIARRRTCRTARRGREPRRLPAQRV